MRCSECQMRLLAHEVADGVCNYCLGYADGVAAALKEVVTAA